MVTTEIIQETGPSRRNSMKKIQKKGKSTLKILISSISWMKSLMSTSSNCIPKWLTSFLIFNSNTKKSWLRLMSKTTLIWTNRKRNQRQCMQKLSKDQRQIFKSTRQPLPSSRKEQQPKSTIFRPKLSKLLTCHLQSQVKRFKSQNRFSKRKLNSSRKILLRRGRMLFKLKTSLISIKKK